MAMADQKKCVVLLTTGKPLANIVTNYLHSVFPNLIVIREPSESKAEIIKRRVRLVGLVETAGQVAAGLILRIVGKVSRVRILEICRESGLDTGQPEILQRNLHLVSSLNSQSTRDLLHQIQPDVVAVYGTRIIGRKTLRSVAAPFINYHAGINPKYRGQHPAYWAIASRDCPNVGVTVHLVDEGVDTGAVIYQAPVRMTEKDNITTYQYVQMATALPLFSQAIEDGLNKRLALQQHDDLPSCNWFPPTIWRYVWNGVVKGIW